MTAHGLVLAFCSAFLTQAAPPHPYEGSILTTERTLSLVQAESTQPLDPAAPTAGERRERRHRRDARLRHGLTLAGVTGVVLLTDQDTQELIGTNDGGTEEEIEHVIQSFGREAGAASVVGLYTLGDRYDKQTAKSAATAALSAALAAEVLKKATGRERPDAEPQAGEFRGPLKGGHSFPSGHAAAAFGLATVYGERYPKYEWAFDALAVGVAISRVREDRHYLGDVFVGALLGTYFGHRAVEGKGGLFGIRF